MAKKIRKQVKKDAITRAVESFGGLVIVDFWAEWCGPCKAYSPILKALANEFRNEIRLFMIDIEKPSNRRLVQQLAIRSVPTLAVYKDGELLKLVVGAMSRDRLLKELGLEQKQK